MKKISLFVILSLILIPFLAISAPRDTLKNVTDHIIAVQDIAGPGPDSKESFRQKLSPQAGP